MFVEDTVTLNFFCVTINSRYTAAIDLYNNGLVPSVLTMVMHYQSNCNNDIFFLDKYETTVEPLLHKNIGIIFAPKELEVSFKHFTYIRYQIFLINVTF